MRSTKGKHSLHRDQCVYPHLEGKVVGDGGSAGPKWDNWGVAVGIKTAPMGNKFGPFALSVPLLQITCALRTIQVVTRCTDDLEVYFDNRNIEEKEKWNISSFAALFSSLIQRFAMPLWPHILKVPNQMGYPALFISTKYKEWAENCANSKQVWMYLLSSAYLYLYCNAWAVFKVCTCVKVELSRERQLPKQQRPILSNLICTCL